MSKAKQTGRPPPRPQGKLLFKYQEVMSLDLSPSLILDQMVRHYQRHAEGSDSEARNFQLLLESKLSYIDSEIASLKSSEFSAIPCDPKETDDDSEEVTEPDLKSLICQIAQDLHSRDSTKRESIEENKIKLDNLIRERRDFLEYLQVISNINLNKQLEDSSAETEGDNMSDTSILSQQFNDPPPLQTPQNVTRRSTRFLTSHQSTSKNLSTLKEEQEKLKQDITIKKKELEDILQEITHRKDESSKLRNSHIPSENSIIDEQSTYSIQSEDLDSEKEIDVQDSTSEDNFALPLSLSQVRKKLKELTQQTTTASPSTRTLDPYARGRRLLENDFIRYGRKTWNEKDVQMFLRICKGYQKQPSQASNDSSYNIPELKNLHSLSLRIKLAVQDLITELDTYRKSILDELDQLKTAKCKYAPLQILQENFYKTFHKKLDELSVYSKEQEDGILSAQDSSLTSSLETLKEELITDLNHHLSSHFKELKSLIHQPNKSPETDITTHQQDLTASDKQKIVLIPNTKKDLPELQKTILDNLKNQDIRPLIHTIKQTKNQNIEIITSKEEAPILEMKLKPKSSNKYMMLDPDKRRNQLIFLGIPQELSSTDLENELKFKNIFMNNDFTIVKNLSSKNKNYNHWVIETNIKNYRNLIRKGIITLYFKRIRVEHFVRVSRCTNCQALNEHTARYCKWQTVCGTCSESHSTSECSNSIISCINCIRSGKKDHKHAAYSAQCPVYQAERSHAMHIHFNQFKTSPSQDHWETHSSSTFVYEEEDFPSLASEKRDSAKVFHSSRNENRDSSSSKVKEYVNSRYKRSYKHTPSPEEKNDYIRVVRMAKEASPPRRR